MSSDVIGVSLFRLEATDGRLEMCQGLFELHDGLRWAKEPLGKSGEPHSNPTWIG